jgi:hypothetical protein
MECHRVGGPYLLLFPRDCELFIYGNLVGIAFAPVLDYQSGNISKELWVAKWSVTSIISVNTS